MAARCFRFPSGVIHRTRCGGFLETSISYQQPIDRSYEYVAHALRTKRALRMARGSVGKHDWCVGAWCPDGYKVFVDDRHVAYSPSIAAAVALALNLIERAIADGDYRLNDKPSGFIPPQIAVAA
mgnify:CR=1 FL=1